MKVRFSRGALADIGEILDYIAERNPRAAEALSERFEQAAKLIGNGEGVSLLEKEVGMQPV